MFEELQKIIETGDYDRKQVFAQLKHNFAKYPTNYELFYLLGQFYLPVNLNQAFLCFENAFFYCDDIDNREALRALCEECRKIPELTVAKTAIIVVSYNGMYLQQKNIQSIRETLCPDSYSLYVVDNGSTDGIREWLQEQPDLILLSNQTNLGFATACNQGVQATLSHGDEASNIFLLNNDTRLAPNTLFWLRMGLYEKQTIGATGSLSNYAGNDQQIDLDFALPQEYIDYGTAHNVLLDAPYEYRVRLSGFSLLVKREAWNLSGGMDEDFTPGYFEDDDLCMKLRSQGFEMLLCHNSFLYHAGSQSFSLKSDVEELLLAHHILFQKKYGFDILDFTTPDISIVEQIPFSKDDEFNLLQIGCGLGADLAWLQTEFPKAHLLGIEKRQNLYQIVSKTGTIFPSVKALTQIFTMPVFHVVIFHPTIVDDLARTELELLKGLSQDQCIFLPSFPKKAFDIPFEQVKLVIWDLDETFWEGTLSEGNVTLKDSAVSLLLTLTDHGIINSISSKNNWEEVQTKLQTFGLWQFFVFPQINWEAKGPQIQSKIKDMKLRPENVLFLDDQPRNLQEALFLLPELLVAGPQVIPAFLQYLENIPAKDPTHKRLHQYSLLEEKWHAEKASSSTEQFLLDSDIHIWIEFDCEKEIDRITELVTRTNQLNFTKVRHTREELLACFQHPDYICGYVKAQDLYGDYGIVGFYCCDQRYFQLIHFVFSCRAMGMGIEQCLYRLLGSPALIVQEPVSAQVSPEQETPWIHVHFPEEQKPLQPNRDIYLTENKPEILLKGTCDLSTIETYLTGGNLTCEFNYINDKGFITSGQNHSMHLWNHEHLTPEEMTALLEEIPFLQKGDFETSLFAKEYHLICYSLTTDCDAGLYRNKSTGRYISFGSRHFSITDPNNWAGLIDGSLQNHGFPFTESILQEFASHWDFVSCTPPDLLVHNLEEIYNKLPSKTRFLLLLGSELPYEASDEIHRDQAAHHHMINSYVRQFARDKERIHLLFMGDFVHSQEDYLDSIYHFKRNVYYDLATEICRIINTFL